MVYSLPIKLLSPSLEAKQNKNQKKVDILSWMVFKLYKTLYVSLQSWQILQIIALRIFVISTHVKRDTVEKWRGGKYERHAYQCPESSLWQEYEP